jgi:hypothetical protein
MRAVALATSLLCGGAAMAAPLPPLPAADFCGTIISREWVPEEHRTARPGASGSLGQERILPAHLRLILGRVMGIPGDLAKRLSFLAGASANEVPEGGMLLLLPAEGPDRFAEAATLCVKGYQVRGDEGITLTSYLSVTVR